MEKCLVVENCKTLEGRQFEESFLQAIGPVFHKYKHENYKLTDMLKIGVKVLMELRNPSSFNKLMLKTVFKKGE